MAEITFEYNAWGMEWQDILNAYPKSDETDFEAVGCGRRTILSEMKIQEGYIASALNSTTMEQIETVDWHEVKTITTSGSFSGFYFDFAPDQNQDIKVYVQDGFYNGGGCLSKSKCDRFDIEDDSSDLETIGVYYDSTLQKWVGEIDRVIPTEDRIIISYSPDKNQLEIPSLRKMLRDSVACIFGSFLYTEGDQEWGLVTRYCDGVEKGMEMISNSRWLPPEFKKLKFINNVIPSGIKSIPIYRN